MENQIIRANETDHEVLTEISFAAKQHWNYPESYFDIWKDELTITKDYVIKNLVFKAVYKNIVVGFYSITENKSDFYSGEIFVKKGFWLEHIFVRPDFHKLGIGRMLIDHAKKISMETGVKTLLIFVDPFAKGFYDKIGALYLYDSKSSIPGRHIPVYELKI